MWAKLSPSPAPAMSQRWSGGFFQNRNWDGMFSFFVPSLCWQKTQVPDVLEAMKLDLTLPPALRRLRPGKMAKAVITPYDTAAAVLHRHRRGKKSRKLLTHLVCYTPTSRVLLVPQLGDNWGKRQGYTGTEKERGCVDMFALLMTMISTRECEYNGGRDTQQFRVMKSLLELEGMT